MIDEEQDGSDLLSLAADSDSDETPAVELTFSSSHFDPILNKHYLSAIDNNGRTIRIAVNNNGVTERTSAAVLAGHIIAQETALVHVTSNEFNQQRKITDETSYVSMKTLESYEKLLDQTSTLGVFFETVANATTISSVPGVVVGSKRKFSGDDEATDNLRLLAISDKKAKSEKTKSYAAISNLHKLQNPETQDLHQLQVGTLMSQNQGNIGEQLKILSSRGLGQGATAVRNNIMSQYKAGAFLNPTRHSPYGSKYHIVYQDNLQWKFKTGKYFHITTGVINYLDVKACEDLYKIANERENDEEHQRTTASDLLISTAADQTCHLPNLSSSSSSCSIMPAITNSQEGFVDFKTKFSNTCPLDDTTLKEDLRQQMPIFKSKPQSEEIMVSLLVQLFFRINDMADIMSKQELSKRILSRSDATSDSEGGSDRHARSGDTAKIGRGLYESLRKNEIQMPRISLFETDEPGLCEQYLMPSVQANFSTMNASMIHVGLVVGEHNIGPDNQPDGVAFDPACGYVVASHDAAAVEANYRILNTPNEDINDDDYLKHMKALQHAVIHHLGAFHTLSNIGKVNASFFSELILELLQLANVFSIGHIKFAMNYARQEQTSSTLGMMLDSIIMSMIVGYLSWRREKKLSVDIDINLTGPNFHSRPSSTTSSSSSLNAGTTEDEIDDDQDGNSFCSFILSRGPKGRMLLLLLFYFEPMYSIHFNLRNKSPDAEAFWNMVMFTMQFDVAFGNHMYGKLKAFSIMQLRMLSPYWSEIFQEYMFTMKQNGKGMETDRLLEFIHKRIKHDVKTVQKEDLFMVNTNMKILEVRDRALEDRKRNKTFFSADRSSGLDMNAVLDERVIDMQHCRQLADKLSDLNVWADANDKDEYLLMSPKGVPHHPKVATMHEDGYVMAQKYFANFSSSLIDGKLEAKELWEQIIEGDLKAPESDYPGDFSHDYMHFAGPNKLEQYQRPLSGEVHAHSAKESKTDRTQRWNPPTDLIYTTCAKDGSALGTFEFEEALKYAFGFDKFSSTSADAISKSANPNVPQSLLFKLVEFYLNFLQLSLVEVIDDIPSEHKIDEIAQTAFDRAGKMKSSSAKLKLAESWLGLRRLILNDVDTILFEIVFKSFRSAKHSESPLTAAPSTTLMVSALPLTMAPAENTATVHDLVNDSSLENNEIRSGWEPWKRRFKSAFSILRDCSDECTLSQSLKQMDKDFSNYQDQIITQPAIYSASEYLSSNRDIYAIHVSF